MKQETEQEVLANQKSDSQALVEKQLVLEIISKKIDKLEQQEALLSSDLSLEFDLELFGEGAGNCTAITNTSSAVMELKSIYKQIEKL